MQLSLQKPPLSMLIIVSKLLHDKAVEEGEEYEYIPTQPLGPGDPGPTQPLGKREDLLLLMPCHMS